MSAGRSIHIDGETAPLGQAELPIMGRGFPFVDGIHAVPAVPGGRLSGKAAPRGRLHRSYAEIVARKPRTQAEPKPLETAPVVRGGLGGAFVRMQVAGGTHGRVLAVPPADVPATVSMSPRAGPIADDPPARVGIGAVTVEVIGRTRRDIEAASPLGEGLANQATVAADESSITRRLAQAGLRGDTRLAVVRPAAETGPRPGEGPMSVPEACISAEAFDRAASAIVPPGVEIGGRPVGVGRRVPRAPRSPRQCRSRARAGRRGATAPTPA